MPYPLSSQLTKDIDFFFMDAQNKKMHFASAGGVLPEMIVLKYKANQRIQSEVQKLEPLFEVEINPNLESILIFESDEMREIYLRDFIFYAKRGFYSYDRTHIMEMDDPRYHLVASPIEGELIPEMINSELMEDLKIENIVDSSSYLNMLSIS